MVEVRKGIWGLLGPTLGSRQGHLEQVAQVHVLIGLEYLHVWPLRSLCATFSILLPLQWGLFFMFTKNILYFSLCFLRFLLSVGTTEKSLNPSSLLPSAIYTHGQDPLKLLFSRLNSPRGLSGCLYNRCSKPLTIFIAHCWAHSSECFSCTGESRAGHSITDMFHQENLLQHAGYTSLVAVGCLCCKGTLLIHGQFCVHENLQVLFAKPPLSWLVPGLYWCLGLFFFNHQDFAFLLVDLHKVSVGPFLQPVEVPLNGNTTFWYINHSYCFCIIYILAEGSLCSIIQMANEDAHTTPAPSQKWRWCSLPCNSVDPPYCSSQRQERNFFLLVLRNLPWSAWPFEDNQE